MTRRDANYLPSPLEPSEAAVLPGLVLLDFGTDWCGHCVAARAAVDAWLRAHARIEHLRIEDGRGRTLGRAFRVKLWPTLVLLREGCEIARVVRPRVAADLRPLEEEATRAEETGS
jgi:thioredoxin 1